MAKYLIRVDDVAPNMDLEKFNKLIIILDKYNIKALLGVIPKNKDSELAKYGNMDEEEFWEMIRELQQKGHTIAIHGFNHKFETRDSGILKINDRSEFAGMSYNEQSKKIKLGLEVFEKEGIRTKVFMAPAHSFDNTTIKVLNENKIKYVTDGFAFHPYMHQNLCFIPQLFATPKSIPVGFYTFVYHPNIMENSDFSHLNIFLEENSDRVVAFEEVMKLRPTKFIHYLYGWFLKYFFYFTRKIRRRKENIDA